MAKFTYYIYVCIKYNNTFVYFKIMKRRDIMRYFNKRHFIFWPYFD